MNRTWPWNRSERERGARELPRDATLRVHPGRRGVVLRADRGVVHVTQAGDLEDHVIEAGEEVRLPRGGLVVAYALQAARLVVCDVLPGNPGRPARQAAVPGFRAA
jgi:hypothetical protein